ncbi:MAG TPA: C25 family cysteine peptidase [Thermoanaerobaculia bacterium]|nr:C25 family cysteine peptidase [Thermoanaerobaculia bacterium]
MKLLATNRAALKAKYESLDAIDAALKAIVDADKARGIDTTIENVDAKKPADAKKAIDALNAQYKSPDYIALVGGPDVIPYQDLQNPLFSPGGDKDEIVWSDLPYACEAPYSTNIHDFTAPSRVVGRIPDLPGAKEPSFLLALLEVAAKWTLHPPSDYAACFGLSTADWQESTKLSLKSLFGDKASLNLSPDAGPAFDEQLLAARTHFINCHGALNDEQFYGQKGGAFPISHRASLLESRRFDATVVAAECCYGGQLFDWSIAARYLAGGAYAYFGSTTIAYGPATSNGLSDNLCQNFLRKAIGGSSTGRAVLEARQEYVKAASFLGPQDLKTIAQFNLLGDPSVHPVKQPKPRVLGMAAVPDRAARRTALREVGAALTTRRAVMQKVDTADAVRDQLLALTEQLGLESRETMSFVAQRPAPRTLGLAAAAAAPPAPARFHVVSGRRRVAGATQLPHVVAVVATETAGKLEYLELHSK